MNENDLMDVCLSKIKYPINDDSAYWKIIKSLRELLKIKDFDKITVIEICKN